MKIRNNQNRDLLVERVKKKFYLFELKLNLDIMFDLGSQ